MAVNSPYGGFTRIGVPFGGSCNKDDTILEL